jgi:hypothetical protein
LFWKKFSRKGAGAQSNLEGFAKHALAMNYQL